MSPGLLVLSVLLVLLAALAVQQRQDTGPVVKRFVEQFAMLVPRMLVALIAAGFIAKLIPKEAIAGLLGEDAGLLALPVAVAAGLIVPAGPVIAFAIAAVFAKSGASVPALVAFVTSWSIFAAHRIFIYEVPLLGTSFLRMRLLSAMAVPFMAGVLAMLAGMISTFGQPLLTH
ncbi:hypothetical protein [uncultured Boseongicola sp.]|jgi:uncharacterized membrane protein YraQ (UPF0718 family)|uniref:hypothetical protein n=1 Tax=uncultured Boseongicola sp. TaxID=1648499 RepID=UPI00261931EE|nr:hypothetical protein [uncultured Boseongicola sp.]